MKKNSLFLLFLMFHLTGCILHVYGQTAAIDNSFNNGGSGANASVYTTALQNDGKIIIGGNFIAYNDTSVNHFARLNTNGSLDTSFHIGTGTDLDIATTTIQSDGKIIIAGYFSSYNNNFGIGNLARINIDGSLDSTFKIGVGTSNPIYASCIQSDGKIIIGGNFPWYNYIARNNIARINTNGSLDTTFTPGTGADDLVFAIASQPNGKIIIGGYFTHYNGIPRNRIARLNADGTLDNNFDPGALINGNVYAISVQSNGKIIIGGSFNYYHNGIDRTNIARLHTDGSLDTTFNQGYGAVPWVVNSLVLQNDGAIIIGGSFSTYNGTARNNIARINTNGSLDTTFNPGTGTDDEVYSISLQNDGKIILSGRFTSYNGTASNRIVRLFNSLMGIENLHYESNIVTIYPNPVTSSSFIIQLNTQLKNAEVVIYDVLGKEILRKTINGNLFEIEKGNLSSGIYLAKVSNDEKEFVRKLIIE